MNENVCLKHGVWQVERTLNVPPIICREQVRGDSLAGAHPHPRSDTEARPRPNSTSAARSAARS